MTGKRNRIAARFFLLTCGRHIFAKHHSDESILEFAENTLVRVHSNETLAFAKQHHIRQVRPANSEFVKSLAPWDLPL